MLDQIAEMVVPIGSVPALLFTFFSHYLGRGYFQDQPAKPPATSWWLLGHCLSSGLF